MASRPGLSGYAISALALAVLTVLLAPILDERHIVDVSLLYLIVTLFAAARWGYRVGIFTAVTADLCVNFFFVPPLHRFTVQEPVNFVGLLLFLCVAVFGAYLLSRLQQQAANARAREAETAFLLEATRTIVRAATPRQAMDRICEALARSAGARGCSIVAGEPLGIAGATIDNASATSLTRNELAVAREVLRTGQVARLAPSSESHRASTFLPMHTPGALLRFVGEVPNSTLQTAVVQALVNEADAALEHDRLFHEAERVAAFERADEFKTVLLDSVSHDLRSPLTAIKAAVSSLRDESVDWSVDDRRSFLETIESQSDRLTATVSNLLQMSRLEGGSVRPHLESIEVGYLLDEIAIGVGSHLKGHPLQVQAAPGIRARADYGLLTQALTNLIENAAKFSPKGSPIEVQASARPGRVELKVKDHGPGIAPGDQAHIFEKFFRGEHTTSVPGSGLGLALAKATVEICGGDIRVDSQPGDTTFSISLPAAVS